MKSRRFGREHPLGERRKSMQGEGGNTPPEKSEREMLLEELSEINRFLKEWGPIYNQLMEKGDSIRKEAKHLIETGTEDSVDLEMFSQIIGEGRNIESVKNEYIQKINRKAKADGGKQLIFHLFSAKIGLYEILHLGFGMCYEQVGC